VFVRLLPCLANRSSDAVVLATGLKFVLRPPLKSPLAVLRTAWRIVSIVSSPCAELAPGLPTGMLGTGLWSAWRLRALSIWFGWPSVSGGVTMPLPEYVELGERGDVVG
jgi:hypothetical protein